MNTKNPLENLKIKTSRLVLKIPNNQEIGALGKVLADGIQKEEEPHSMDESLYGRSAEEHSKGLGEFIHKSTDEWNKDNWHLPFAVFFEDKPIGLVTMFSHDFPIAKGFGCSYWIGLSYQGKGLGTEAFQAVLSFGFDGIDAKEAYVGAYSDNIPSLKLMEKLGFLFNGEYWMARQGKAIKDKRMRLPKENWKKPEGITIEGLNELTSYFD